MQKWYREDLAYIHDAGYRDYAFKSALGILEILLHRNIRDGLVVDLGCGSGVSALAFANAGYRVLGIDISEAMIAIARTSVPAAEFRVESLYQTEIPPCQAVTAIGECLNYCFEIDIAANCHHQKLSQLFDHVHSSLLPGGVLIFDIAEPGQVSAGTITRNFTEGKDWIVLVEKEEVPQDKTLARRIMTLRQIGETYRREEEVHLLRLYEASEIAEDLQQVGFQVQLRRGYGQFNLPSAHAVVIAQKPE